MLLQGRETKYCRENRLLLISLQLRNYLLTFVDSALRSNFNFKIIRKVLEIPYQAKVTVCQSPRDTLQYNLMHLQKSNISWNRLEYSCSKAVLFNTDLGLNQFTSLQQTILPSSVTEAEFSNTSLLWCIEIVGQRIYFPPDFPKNEVLRGGIDYKQRCLVPLGKTAFSHDWRLWRHLLTYQISRTLDSTAIHLLATFRFIAGLACLRKKNVILGFCFSITIFKILRLHRDTYSSTPSYVEQNHTKKLFLPKLLIVQFSRFWVHFACVPSVLGCSNCSGVIGCDTNFQQLSSFLGIKTLLGNRTQHVSWADFGPLIFAWVWIHVVCLGRHLEAEGGRSTRRTHH